VRFYRVGLLKGARAIEELDLAMGFAQDGSRFHSITTVD